jgi:hypothetical protein
MLTVKELRAEASRLKIKGRSRMNKAELSSAINNYGSNNNLVQLLNLLDPPKNRHVNQRGVHHVNLLYQM